MVATTRPAADGRDLLTDPALHALYEFTEHIAANVQSQRQRERVLAAARVPMTRAGLGVLRLVHRHGPVVVSDLARRLGLDLSTVSRQLRPLEEEGLVARSSDRDDRRVVWLALTPKGRRVIERTTRAWLEDYQHALEGWSPADRAVLAELIERLRRDLLERAKGMP
ncbi:MAG: hypothetical protein KatS3mg009_2873 [Acidimicrobiia bacterium]|nr:MAG: hypothetical protein KatS3mg009_2873 [Acidimicrobiia bacterium]